LIGHACWIDAAFGAVITIVTFFWARYLAMSISKSEDYLEWATPMLRTANWESPFGWIRNVVQTTLQALQYGTTATLYSFGATFLSYLAIVSILYVTDKTDFVRLLLTMPLHGAVAAVAGILLVIVPLRKIWKERAEVAAEAVGEEELPLELISNETEREDGVQES
jgi:Na+-driven multidrug efflux pump